MGITLINTYKMAVNPADGTIYRKKADCSGGENYLVWKPGEKEWEIAADGKGQFENGYEISEEDANAALDSKVGLAKLLSKYYHRDQKDKAGAEYWKHPASVAENVDSEDEKIVAYLHDVLEDTDIPQEVVLNNFGQKILDAVIALTRSKDTETYEEFIERCGKNDIAINVKLADLKHNMDISRLPEITAEDYARVEKYKKAEQYLFKLKK